MGGSVSDHASAARIPKILQQSVAINQVIQEFHRVAHGKASDDGQEAFSITSTMRTCMQTVCQHVGISIEDIVKSAQPPIFDRHEDLPST